jgi:hypothetical protein
MGALPSHGSVQDSVFLMRVFKEKELLINVSKVLKDS